jgi:hypothetical protein
MACRGNDRILHHAAARRLTDRILAHIERRL